jgi:chromatin assembly factor 1 subunit A
VSTAQDQYPTHISTHKLNQRDSIVPQTQCFTDSGALAHGMSEVASLMPKRGLPKTNFPDAHLSVLLSKITSLATGNMTFLVESVFQELREHNVRKNAIEAKLKEVGEKCKHKRIWVVKDDVAVSLCLSFFKRLS